MEHLSVIDKFTQETLASVPMASRADVDSAIAHAVRAEPAMRKLKAHERRAACMQAARGIEARKDKFIALLMSEGGKIRRDAITEVERAIEVFASAAEEATRIYGEVMPVDTSARTANHRGMWQRVPVGACAFITPFNFPINLVAHKVAPALAVGCPFVLKPALLTPLCSLLLAEVLGECTLPEGAFSVVVCSNEDASALIEDERIKLLSFTGSPAVGWALKARAGKKKVVLELGGNAAVIVEPDANIDDAVKRITPGAFAQAGQSCISVQRIFVHRSIQVAFTEKLLSAIKALKAGNPHDASTDLGPMVSEKEAARLESWINNAISKGASLLCGGHRQQTLFEATLIEKVSHDAELYRFEAFGPIALIEPYDDFSDALQRVNDSEFGLQAGVFTQNLNKAYQAWDELQVGGVVINDVSNFRVDAMPYGGVKNSGLGREGVRFAIEDMTEIRMMLVRSS